MAGGGFGSLGILIERGALDPPSEKSKLATESA
jgi:hypothetical protein